MSEPTVSMSDHCGNAGALPTVTLKGVKKTVCFPTPKIISRMELAIAEAAFAEAKEMAAFRPGVEDEVLTKITAKHHRIFGPFWNATMASSAGTTLLLWACISDKHPDFTMADAIQVQKEDRDGVRLALACVSPPFCKVLAGMSLLTLDEVKSLLSA